MPAQVDGTDQRVFHRKQGQHVVATGIDQEAAVLIDDVGHTAGERSQRVGDGLLLGRIPICAPNWSPSMSSTA